MPTPRPVEFRSAKNLVRRLHAGREPDSPGFISVDDADLPAWQRQLVWSSDDMGLLALSILRGYPIGQIILWRKPDGIRVPIDGRQRLTAIKRFAEGHVAIPSLRHVPADLRGKKYVLQDQDPDELLLPLELRDLFDDYEPAVLEYEDIDEDVAKDIFVKLQGGKSLNKAEVRAALPGLVTDFVSELTSPPAISEDGNGEDEEDEPSAHPFFREVQVPNRRKAHRGLCDVLLHEFLYPGQDKHWSSLESLYLDKATTLSEREKAGFRQSLSRFHRAVRISGGGEERVHPRLRSTFLILTYYRAWQELEAYAMPDAFSFRTVVEEFERLRQERKDEVPFVNFNAALSNAGYAENRCAERHRILMSFVLQRFPGAVMRDDRRSFTDAQKVAIWERAGGRCEWTDSGGSRCVEEFADFRDADADHIVRWTDGGATTVENGRLLCVRHNRATR